MAGTVTNAERDTLITTFRYAIMGRRGEVPFPHQAAWWAASDGLMLLEGVHDTEGMQVAVPNDPDDPTAGSRIETWAVVPREGGRAKVIADLAAFKGGKSYSAGMWAAAFAFVPGSHLAVVGMEYDICGPEFSYIEEALFSERGMNLPLDRNTTVQNRPRDGKMFIDLPNGAHFEARSWERRESLKGKEVDAYIFAEAYQFPGIEVFTSISQNLRARQGYAIFPTTPDRPWLQELHNRAHSGDDRFSDWHCTCGVDARQNFYVYDPRARERDKEIMTREKFVIHYEGRLGDFVGRVFNYQRGQKQFTPGSHPELFPNFDPRKTATIADLRFPPGWDIVIGGDTGTFYSAVAVAFSPEGEAFVFAELPNYRYVADRPERDEMLSIPMWAKIFHRTLDRFSSRSVMWVDPNSQFKRELQNYDISLIGDVTPVEARTEITREYFQHDKIRLAPWLSVLPFELENAQWPEEATAAGKFARVKDRDHALDGLEHVLARRPRGRMPQTKKPDSWIEGFLGRIPHKRVGNAHMGE